MAPWDCRGQSFVLARPGLTIDLAGSWRGFSCWGGVPTISGANLFAGLLFSSIGFVGFIFGKRLSLWKPMFIGIALMAYPYFIEDTLTLCAIGLAGTAALFWARN